MTFFIFCLVALAYSAAGFFRNAELHNHYEQHIARPWCEAIDRGDYEACEDFKKCAEEHFKNYSGRVFNPFRWFEKP